MPPSSAPWASIALARSHRCHARTLLSGLVTAPLVMPEPITGIASLSAFILMAKWIGRPANRGVTTITLAHVTFSMVFVTTVVRSRMIEADIAIEEAALDLGERPWQVLRDVTLPVIAPVIVAGWNLALTISLDDGVISNFVTGPGNTTLPILIWSRVKLGVIPDINALTTITMLIVGTGVAIAVLLLHRTDRRRARDERLAMREKAG